MRKNFMTRIRLFYYKDSQGKSKKWFEITLFIPLNSGGGFIYVCVVHFSFVFIEEKRLTEVVKCLPGGP
jgi:hypothetical protein